MLNQIEQKLNDLGITLPSAAAPAANYVPFVKSGNMLFVSGQISQSSEGLILGKLGDNFSLEEGYKAARCCGLALISQVKSACDGDWTHLKQVVRLGGFVNCTENFRDHPKVINGASDLMIEIFGEKGAHARADRRDHPARGERLQRHAPLRLQRLVGAAVAHHHLRRARARQGARAARGHRRGRRRLRARPGVPPTHRLTQGQGRVGQGGLWGRRLVLAF